MLSMAMLLGLTLVAAVTDVLRNKIYNWNTYSGILAALALSAVGSVWLWADAAAEQRLRGWLGGPPLLDSVGGLVTCGLLMIVCFAFFPGIGGGDVKLMAMVGSLLGWEKGMEALLWTFVLGACFGLIVLVWRVGPATTVSRVVRLVSAKLRLPWFMPLSNEERTALKPPIFLAPSALLAVVIVRLGLIK
ncbi:MAG: A24 family peptidase [Thermoguttaceae bacterium]|jgi:Flp pilus assembly protein protease CpaA